MSHLLSHMVVLVGLWIGGCVCSDSFQLPACRTPICIVRVILSVSLSCSAQTHRPCANVDVCSAMALCYRVSFLPLANSPAR